MSIWKPMSRSGSLLAQHALLHRRRRERADADHAARRCTRRTRPRRRRSWRGAGARPPTADRPGRATVTAELRGAGRACRSREERVGGGGHGASFVARGAPAGGLSRRLAVLSRAATRRFAAKLLIRRDEWTFYAASDDRAVPPAGVEPPARVGAGRKRAAAITTGRKPDQDDSPARRLAGRAAAAAAAAAAADDAPPSSTACPCGGPAVRGADIRRCRSG